VKWRPDAAPQHPATRREKARALAEWCWIAVSIVIAIGVGLIFLTVCALIVWVLAHRL
jgi:hypothetical protein